MVSLYLIMKLGGKKNSKTGKTMRNHYYFKS